MEMDNPRNLLIAGYPGVGKTSLSLVLARGVSLAHFQELDDGGGGGGGCPLIPKRF